MGLRYSICHQVISLIFSIRCYHHLNFQEGMSLFYSLRPKKLLHFDPKALTYWVKIQQFYWDRGSNSFYFAWLHYSIAYLSRFCLPFSSQTLAVFIYASLNDQGCKWISKSPNSNPIQIVNWIELFLPSDRTRTQKLKSKFFWT